MDAYGKLYLNGEAVALGFVEIKSKIASSGLGATFELTTPDLVRCDLVDEKCRRYLRSEHINSCCTN